MVDLTTKKKLIFKHRDVIFVRNPTNAFAEEQV